MNFLPGSCDAGCDEERRRERCHERYVHTLRMAYRARRIAPGVLERTLPRLSECRGLSPAGVIRQLCPAIGERLASYNAALCDTLLSEPICRTMEFSGKTVTIPIINSQGQEWYANSPLEHYDFTAESRLGLHERCRVIYDFGGHHGIWALYYSTIVGDEGRVYSFEPSIINVEVSALLFLANQVTNVVNIAAAIGAGSRRDDERSRMLVDFVDKESVEIVNVRDVCWDKADFLKMDIEGFEYDILTENPWMFELARNMHIELHIPHLLARGLDYRKVLEVLPFEEFDVFNHDCQHPVHAASELSGFCGLMLRRRR